MTITVFSTATELGAAIGAGTTTSHAICQMYLNRIAAKNPLVNAVIAQRTSAAILAEADAADVRAAAGTRKSPLDGVPFTLKMALSTAGLLTANVNAANYAVSPLKDSDIAGKLLAAGCILIGKTNMGVSPARTVSSLFGETKNPHNTAYAAGGSSGGPACAVAAGFTAFDIGIDSAGSNRIPSAICGVYGFAPTNGSVSGRGDWSTDMPSMPPTDMLDLYKYGPIARSITDLEMLYQIMAGPTQLRPNTPRVFPSIGPTLHKIKSIKQIGVWTCNWQSQIDALLSAQSCIIDTSTPTISWFDETVLNNVYGGLANDTTQLPAYFRSTFGGTENPYYGAQIPYGTTFAGKTYQAKAHAVWLSAVAATLFGDIELATGDVDVLAMGTVALSPPLVGVNPIGTPYMAFTALWNITGHPCVTLPLGTDPNGIPFGLQLIARPGHDMDLLAFAKQIAGLPGFVAPTL